MSNDFRKGDRARVKMSVTTHPWHGLEGEIVRTPHDAKKPGKGIPAAGAYAMKFDGRRGTFAPLQSYNLTKIEG